MSAAHNLPPRKRCRGNLRPAPFFLNESTVRGVIELQFGKRMAGVPVADIALADRPRAATAPYPFRDHRALAELPGCEPAPEPDPLHEPAPDAPESPDWPDAPLPDSFPEPERIGLDTAPAPAPETAKSIEARPRRAECPRIDLIRAAAEALRDIPAPARAAEPQREPRPLPGPRAPRAAALPPLPFEQRRRRLDGAIRFLASRGVLVTPVDRLAAIRTYRVSGKRDPKLAEEVIEIAAQRGFAPDGDLS